MFIGVALLVLALFIGPGRNGWILIGAVLAVVFLWGAVDKLRDDSRADCLARESAEMAWICDDDAPGYRR